VVRPARHSPVRADPGLPSGSSHCAQGYPIVARCSDRRSRRATRDTIVSTVWPAAAPALPRCSGAAARLFVHDVVDPLCQFAADARHALEVVHAGAADPLQAAEMLDQALAPLGPDAVDLLER